IDKLVFEISFYYLSDSHLRSRFMAEEHRLVNSYINDYQYGRLNFARSMECLQKHYQILSKSRAQLQMGSVKLYAIAERERGRHSSLTIVLKQVRFVSGAMQVIGGFGLCKTTLSAACKTYGVPLMVQGSENVWENGYYLLYHQEPGKMPLRYAYRQAAKLMGGDEKDGDIAFSTGDLILSFGSASTLTLRSDSWKLFHYIREDYIRNWRTLGVAGGMSELIGDAVSGFTIYHLLGGESTNWAELRE
ncbi:DUF4225 domain-containing protein, partial [Salmonella enterica]|nr:DUF4225 domain-containing protein [Salmonella enterica]EIE0017489.1 DUF4225 domain-containing protein [Salmonella enterica]EIE0951328.1 DUF4225 domain-containing protein [Salmonella enterica]EIM0135278.1 DUF4225 domain-containing protein [Salmonella enterica]EJK3198839.1 DUF4225 domain-containing protein [Salmonella enterica]